MSTLPSQFEGRNSSNSPEIITLSDDDDLSTESRETLGPKPASKKSKHSHPTPTNAPAFQNVSDAGHGKDGKSHPNCSQSPSSTMPIGLQSHPPSNSATASTSQLRPSSTSTQPNDLIASDGDSSSDEVPSQPLSPKLSLKRGLSTNSECGVDANEKGSVDSESESNLTISTSSTFFAHYHFLNASRVLLMKTKAYCLLNRQVDLLGSCDGHHYIYKLKFSTEALPLNFFPDDDLNTLIERILIMDIGLYQVVTATILIFWYQFELKKHMIPSTYPCNGKSQHPIMPGCDIFFKFWDAVFGKSSCPDPKIKLQNAIDAFNIKFDRVRKNISSQ